MADDHEALIARLTQENERLWRENNVLRPMVSDLQHRLSVAIKHLKAQAETQTAALIRKNRDHG